MPLVWKRLAAGYLILLAASTAARFLRRGAEPLAPDQRVERVAPKPGRVATDTVTIVYRDVGPRADSIPVLLIHGSPGHSREMAGIGKALGSHRRSLTPDLPGFGASSRRIPDYSIEAHAAYLEALLDSLEIARVHVVGFSMGGGVGLHLADRAPTRVASLTLLSSIGLQEFELLGDYRLNHVLHWAQWVGLWIVENLVPHFGLWDHSMLSVGYARNFYDTDQRPLQRLIETFPGPALIIHGDKDPLVDSSVAVETHRLMPQSELVMFRDPSADHFLAFMRPDTLAHTMAAFFDRVERGTAPDRLAASSDRQSLASRPFDPKTVPPPTGIALAVFLLLLAVATFISEDLSCLTAGLLVSRGTLEFLPAATACFVGIVIGDIGLFVLGRSIGRAALRQVPMRWLVSERAIERASAWFAKQGVRIVLTSRFIPGSRFPTFLTAGILHVRAAPFMLAFLVGAIIWTPALVAASTVVGAQLLSRLHDLEDVALPGLIAIALGLVISLKGILPLFSWKGRRLWLSRWRRLSRWEYWPRWAFYPPVVWFILRQMIARRSLRYFTAVNPGIAGGGFVGESKAEILRQLDQSRVAPWQLIPSGGLEQRFAAIESFVRGSQAGYPLVLKPDIGERGDGVAIIRSEHDVRRYLEQTEAPILAQRYVAGIEVGIFYYRLPGEDRGHIFAITEKRLITVIGNGRSTLERLILEDDRAIGMAGHFLTIHAAQLDAIPDTGKIVPLVELGTHCRGAMFLDGEHLRTAELELAIDRLSRSFPGFWFGRYDIRAASVEALQRGEDFWVIELNGATAEATNIYDPKNRLCDAYRTLRTQWRLLFEIADRNVASGVTPATWAEIRALVRSHREAKRNHVGR